MNENLKEKLNIIARCAIYTIVISYTFCSNGSQTFNTIFFIKILLDAFFIDMLFVPLDNFITFSDKLTEDFWTYLTLYNYAFFAYFYAKICGLYKKFKKCNFLVKYLIFLIISIFAYLISIFDFKNCKLLENNSNNGMLFYAIFIISALCFNYLFNFLTKKFPIPFEKIGYLCSIEFFKDLIKKIKR